MFLDSDDELPRHACKSLLAEIERTGGRVRRGPDLPAVRVERPAAPLLPVVVRPAARGRGHQAGARAVPRQLQHQQALRRAAAAREHAALPRGHPLRGPRLRHRALRGHPQVRRRALGRLPLAPLDRERLHLPQHRGPGERAPAGDRGPAERRHPARARGRRPGAAPAVPVPAPGPAGLPQPAAGQGPGVGQGVRLGGAAVPGGDLR
ncbi:hypothetical protein [Nonomuraea salmonea]|uniref:hypothetical protein n=1 Tax=Nonomuraea salmonea TaxID=46181 RepID=UPI0031EA0FE5